MMGRGNEREGAPRIGRKDRAAFLAAHPNLVPLGTLRRRFQTAPPAAYVYNSNNFEWQPWCDPAQAVAMPEDEANQLRAQRRARDMARRERLRCPRCGRLAARSYVAARKTCHTRDLIDLGHGSVEVCLCRRCSDAEHAARVEARRAALAAASKKPVPNARSLPAAIVLDTETTGLRAGSDHLLTIGICDENGNEVAYFEVCPPAECFEWPEAQAINGISPEDALDWPSLDDVRPELQRVLSAAETVVCYNAAFDLGFLKAAGFTVPARVEDVMLDFAEVYGEWSDYFDDYKWQPLWLCARHYGAPDFEAHNSLADAQATAWCRARMLNEREER